MSELFSRLKNLLKKLDEPSAAGPDLVTEIKPIEIEPRTDGTEQLLRSLQESLEKSLFPPAPVRESPIMMGLKAQLEADLKTTKLSDADSVRSAITDAIQYAVERQPRLTKDHIQKVVEHKLNELLSVGMIAGPPVVEVVDSSMVNIGIKLHSHAEHIMFTSPNAFDFMAPILDVAPEPAPTFLEDLKGI